MSAQEPIRRDLKYRPSCERSIAISGVIDDALVARLLPEIVKLQSDSRDPITIYIESSGGDTECAKLLLDALRASDQDQSEPCRLITVALGEASSAASDILMAGDYALAYPYTKVLCHGTRHIISRPTAFTKDVAASFAKDMAGLDEEFAITLARNCINRFMFRISRVWRTVEDLGKTEPGLFSANEFPTAESIGQEFRRFLQTNGLARETILGQLDVAAKSVSGTIMLVPNYSLEDEQNAKENASLREQAIRAAILKNALADTSSEARFSGLEAKYLLVRDFLAAHHREMIGTLQRRWWRDLIGRGDLHEVESAEPTTREEQASKAAERITMRCFLLWFLFVFFCRQLQTDDFPMTATEAYWLGLIDEVIGLDLPSPRILVENAPDIPSEQQGVPQP
jgi:ATP-dependent protease ClpP protease subunit